MDIDEGTQRSIVNTVTGGEIPPPPDQNAFIESALSSVFFFAGFVALAFIVYGGFQYVISSGDPQKTEQAKNTILYAVIGFIIALSAFTIVNLTLGAAES